MTDFMKAMADEVAAQGGEGCYYTVVTLEPPQEGDTLYHMEKVDFRPGNPAHDCYSVAKSVAVTAAGCMTGDCSARRTRWTDSCPPT